MVVHIQIQWSFLTALLFNFAQMVASKEIPCLGVRRSCDDQWQIFQVRIASPSCHQEEVNCQFSITLAISLVNLSQYIPSKTLLRVSNRVLHRLASIIPHPTHACMQRKRKRKGTEFSERNIS
jgi:hypothetical protein